MSLPESGLPPRAGTVRVPRSGPGCRSGLGAEPRPAIWAGSPPGLCARSRPTNGTGSRLGMAVAVAVAAKEGNINVFNMQLHINANYTPSATSHQRQLHTKGKHTPNANYKMTILYKKHLQHSHHYFY